MVSAPTTRLKTPLKWEVQQLCMDNDILKTKMEIIPATERPNVTHVRESMTWCVVTSSATPRNNSVKTYKDTLSVGYVSMTRNPSLIMWHVKYERYEESTMSITSSNGNNAVQIVDGFTAVKWTKARKETSNMPLQCVKKNKQPTIRVSCSSSLFSLVKWVKITYLFASHFSPEVSAT
jgi:hypothetical protein